MPVPEHLTGGNKRPSHPHKMKIKHYLHKVSELLLKGHTPYEIGLKLRPNNKSVDWVYKCIKRIHQTLNLQIEANADQYLKMMEARYNKIMTEMWEAWELSKTDHKGNPRLPQVVYMDRILATMEALRKLHGLDKQIESKPDGKSAALDWDSITRGRQLTSMTVNVNNTTVATQNNNAIALAPSPEPQLSPTEKLKLDLKKRMEELERRAVENIEKPVESGTSLCEDDTPAVPSPVIYRDAQHTPKPKQAIRRIILKPINKG